MRFPDVVYVDVRVSFLGLFGLRDLSTLDGRVWGWGKQCDSKRCLGHQTNIIFGRDHQGFSRVRLDDGPRSFEKPCLSDISLEALALTL